MDFKNILEKIKIFNDFVNKNHENKTKNERLLLKSLKISEEVWEFHNEILGHLWFTRAWKKHSRDDLEKECSDVILSTLLVACDLWIDIEKILDDKLKIVFDRYNLEYK